MSHEIVGKTNDEPAPNRRQGAYNQPVNRTLYLASGLRDTN